MKHRPLSIFAMTLLLALVLTGLSVSAAPAVNLSLPDSGDAIDSLPTVTEVGKYLVISMGDDGDVGRAFQMSNSEIGADREVLSTPSDSGCPTDGGFPDLLDVFGGDTPPRWNLSTDPDSLNGAESLFQGTDWSGEVALTSNNGKFDSSNSLVFADIGIQSAASNPTTGGPSISNSYFFDVGVNAPCSNGTSIALGDGATGNNSFTDLHNELTAWKTYIESLTAELTINSNSAFQNDEASNGNGGLRTNYDGDDTNGDGVVVIDVNSNSNLGDFNLVNLDWVIDGNGDKLVIFRLRNGSNMIMNEVSITLGDGGIASNGIGVIFYSGYEGDSGDTVFNTGSSLVANGVGFWDLNQIGEGGGDVKTNINFNNAQGCAQFISQKVNFQNNRWIRCEPSTIKQAKVAIGNLLWEDTDDSSTLNGAEKGIDGIDVRLFRDNNGNSICEPGTDQVVGSDQTTAGGGLYQFLGVDPSNAADATTYYCVGVDSIALKAQGFSSSSTGGNHNPDGTGDHPVTGGDDGVPSGDWIISQPFAATLMGQTASDNGDPAGYADENAYMTVDFGVLSGGATAVNLKAFGVEQSLPAGLLVLVVALLLTALYFMRRRATNTG